METSQTVMVVGVMVGAMFFTALSDNFGRKPVFLFSQWAMVVVGVATAFCNNYYVFAVLRFFAGALQQVGESSGGWGGGRGGEGDAESLGQMSTENGANTNNNALQQVGKGSGEWGGVVVVVRVCVCVCVCGRGLGVRGGDGGGDSFGTCGLHKNFRSNEHREWS